ncbi:MAG: anthranilate synthase component II [Alphaproteobacteria bacterium]
MYLIIDNYDSFVHNLARYFECTGQNTKVVRNDKITIEEIYSLAPEAIILSPGPCSPNEAGICLEIVENLGASIPMLGVCLGHQVIGQVYGGVTMRAPVPVHGKASLITHDKTGLFENLPSPFKVGRYHSLITQPVNSRDLEFDAHSEDGVIMALHHTQYPVYGVQFHPESILTEYGIEVIQNFVNIAQAYNSQTKRAA